MLSQKYNEQLRLERINIMLNPFRDDIFIVNQNDTKIKIPLGMK